MLAVHLGLLVGCSGAGFGSTEGEVSRLSSNSLGDAWGTMTAELNSLRDQRSALESDPVLPLLQQEVECLRARCDTARSGKNCETAADLARHSPSHNESSTGRQDAEAQPADWMLGEAFAATAAAVERLQGEMQHGIADQGDTIAQISKEIEYLRALPTPECGPAAPARCGTPGASTFASAASASFVARISKAEATLKWGYCGQSDPSFDDEPGELAVGVGTCASMLHARAEPLARTFGARFRDLHWYSEDTLDSQLIRNVTRIRPFEGEERKSEFGGAWLSLPILHHLFLESPAAKWYLILDDDTFLIPENLLCQVRLLARCFALGKSHRTILITWTLTSSSCEITTRTSMCISV